MASFNVSCSVSGISIYEGAKAYFFALKKSDERDGLIYTNSFFTPLTLPIEGEYADSGYLTNIKDSETTRIIEERYGISVEQFISIIDSGKGLFYLRGKMYEIYGIHKEMVMDFNIGLQEEFFTKLGLVKKESLSEKTIDKMNYIFESRGYSQKLSLDASVYQMQYYPEIYVIQNFKSWFVFNNITNKRYDFRDKDDFFEYFYEATDKKCLLNYPEEKIDLIKELDSLSGMFILKEVYDFLADEYEDDFFEEKVERIKEQEVYMTKYVSKIKDVDEKEKLDMLSMIRKELFSERRRYLISEEMISYYTERFNIEEIYDMIKSFVSFDYALWLLAKVYTPVPHGKQGGDYKEMRDFHKKCASICSEIVKERIANK